MFKYSAVIIEPREHKALEFVLNNILTNLSDEWGLVIFHGRKNKNFILNLFENSIKKFKHRLDKCIELDVDNLSIDQYSNLCKSSAFYKCINTEIMLLFQVDSIILDANKNLINKFLVYDYVGAPWLNGVVGNGGFSLRRKSKMIEICDNVPHNIINHPHEDNYFSYQNIIPLNKPSFQEAQTFSVETVFHEKSFGIHAPWKHLNKYELEFLTNTYPEISILIELNK
jgi:hypothetical protein